MTNIFSRDVEGLNELIDAFTRLPEDALETLEKHTLEVGKTIRDKAKANAAKHHKSGDLEKSIRVSGPSKKRKKKYVVFTSVKTTKKAPHAYLLEFGHKLVRQGKTIGTVKAYPFMRPAFDSTKGAAYDAVVDALNEALDKWGEK